ncbi:hypothetical protein CRG98_036996 [Punica granatum]|uniref:Uncharacterized protein n=1 Tax=Punica granatum TaxID=22663 RepID=A0A2I0IF32_PUNGR|nr:hypothetical protein CRG98_036996 [Punica granatum]
MRGRCRFQADMSYKEKLKGEGAEAANRRPRPLHRGRQRPLWVSALDGPDPDPSTEVAGVLCGCRRSRWRGRDCRLAAPIPSPFDFSL